MSYRPLPTEHASYLTVGPYAISAHGVVFELVDPDTWRRRAGFLSKQATETLFSVWLDGRDDDVLAAIAKALIESETSGGTINPGFSAN